MKPKGSQFHGTPAHLAEGSVIKATPDTVWGGPDAAWATTNQESAASYAEAKVKPWFIDPPVKGYTPDPVQGQLFTNVYEVEHTSEPQPPPYQDSAITRDYKGLRVKQHLDYRNTSDMSYGSAGGSLGSIKVGSPKPKRKLRQAPKEEPPEPPEGLSRFG